MWCRGAPAETVEGADYATVHDSRRSCGTHWAKRLSADVVQALAGHSDIRTTLDYYVKVRDEDITWAAEITAARHGTDPDRQFRVDWDARLERPQWCKPSRPQHLWRMGRSGLEPPTHGFSVRDLAAFSRCCRGPSAFSTP